MDKTIIGLLSGASALALIGGAQAAPAPTGSAVQPASSFAELMDPIPHAVELLNADNQHAAAATVERPMEVAQYYHHHHHHHYHHHHYHHHHHHHYY